MTGEMSWINSKGEDSNGESYPVHAKVARTLRCRLRPFDQYIGPYIATKHGKVFITSEDGWIGDICLWPGGVAPAYREPVVWQYYPVDDADAALAAVREVLKKAKAA